MGEITESEDSRNDINKFVVHKSYKDRLSVAREQEAHAALANKLLRFIKINPELASEVWALDKGDSLVDGLTDVFNRRFLDLELEVQIAQRERSLKDNKKTNRLSIFKIDLDNLKWVNDGRPGVESKEQERSGHDLGDEYLITAVTCIKDSVRKQDRICRFGGDEFVVIIEEADDKQIIGIRSRIQSRFRELQIQQNLPSFTGLSIGQAVWEKGENPKILLKKADTDMYEDKNIKKGNTTDGQTK